MPPKIVQRAQEIYSTEIATVEADDDGLATRCWSCLTSMEADDREFYYSETGVCHCQYHVPPPEMQAAASEFLGNATRRLQECFGPCTITIDPPGYTLANRVRDLKRERAKPL